MVEFKSNSHQEGQRNAWTLPSMVGRGTEHPKFGQHIDQGSNYPPFGFFLCEPLHSCMCLFEFSYSYCHVLTSKTQMLICQTEGVIEAKREL